MLAVAWLTSGAAGAVRNASREDVEPERPSRQSWVLRTGDPSAHMTDGMSVGSEKRGSTVERLGRRAVKLATVDGTEDLGGC